MRILIFDEKINGHHLEYIHHLYEAAARQKNHFFIFVIPEGFVGVKNKFCWGEADNIVFDLIPSIKTNIQEGSLARSLKKSFKISRLVKFYCKKHSADAVFMNSIMSIIPASLLLLNYDIRIYGIVYQIYLYRDSNSSLVTKIADRLKYVVLSKSKSIRNIFILNDNDSSKQLNTIYKTNKFMYLADPYLPIQPDSTDVREAFGISQKDKLLIHIGSLERRKGTLLLLETIERLAQTNTNNYTFFFAGKVDQAIRAEFYERLNRICGIKVIVKDEFCSYGFLGALCKSADVILMPYLLDNLSSGIIGYASQFCTPVIAPSSGLIGSIVRFYNLGYMLPHVDSDSLIDSFYSVGKGEMVVPDKTYCLDHTLEEFQSTIMSEITKKTR